MVRLSIKTILIFIVFNLFCSSGLQIPQFNTREEAFLWVHNNIISTPEEINYWQTPEETIQRRAGDCEDFSILLMEIFKTQFNDDPSFVKIRIYYYDGTGFVDHAIVENKRILYDPTLNQYKTLNYSYDIIGISNYTETMYNTYFHTADKY